MSSSQHSESTTQKNHAVEAPAKEPEATKTNGAAQRSGIVTPFALPTGINCSPIFRDPKGGRGPGIYGTPVFGTLAAGTAITAAAKINLCYIPPNSILGNFVIVTAGVTGTLQDSLATPTIYAATLAGPVNTWAQVAAANAQNLGTMYASTPRAVGANGPAVVQWQTGTLLQIVAAATFTPTTPMIFMLEWLPTYDAGV